MGKEKKTEINAPGNRAHIKSYVFIYYSYLHIVTKRLVIVHDLMPYVSGLRYTS